MSQLNALEILGPINEFVGSILKWFMGRFIPRNKTSSHSAHTQNHCLKTRLFYL